MIIMMIQANKISVVDSADPVVDNRIQQIHSPLWFPMIYTQYNDKHKRQE